MNRSFVPVVNRHGEERAIGRALLGRRASRAATLALARKGEEIDHSAIAAEMEEFNLHFAAFAACAGGGNRRSRIRFA
jgi:hypothetical protein